MEEESVPIKCRGVRENCLYNCKSKNTKVETINNIILVLNEEVYAPSDDTFIIATGVLQITDELAEKHLIITELGCGTGYVTILAVKKILSKGFSNMYAILIDISPCAVESALKSVKANELNTYMDIIQCDGASCLRGGSAELILFNPPYLPVEDGGGWLEKSWSGGSEGLVVWDKFFGDALRICKGSCPVVFTISSLQNLAKILQRLQNSCKIIEIHECVNFFYEIICSVCCIVGAVK
ncbi:MAG: methyltransferase [Ignisphaera sp.]|jgi:release factor glutamine methyltransferase|nr:methyltransferase [Ignisphaera sp.]